jgi:hypothetical protein
MPEVIWKFPIVIDDYQILTMPRYAQVLSVAMVRDEPAVYALCDPTADLVDRGIRSVGTGNPIVWTERMDFVGTFQMLDGALVWHVFVSQGGRS